MCPVWLSVQRVLPSSVLFLKSHCLGPKLRAGANNDYTGNQVRIICQDRNNKCHKQQFLISRPGADLWWINWLPSLNSFIFNFPGSWFKTVATANGFDNLLEISSSDIQFPGTKSGGKIYYFVFLSLLPSWLACHPLYLNLWGFRLGWQSMKTYLCHSLFWRNIYFLRESI